MLIRIVTEYSSSISLQDGELRPRRIKDFTTFLAQHLSENNQSTLISTGSTALGFSPDSRKLVLGLAFSPSVCIIELGQKDQAPHFVRKLNHHFSSRDTVRKLAGKEIRKNGDEDAMEVTVEGEESENLSHLLERPRRSMVTRLAFSPDGQWLATSDDNCRTHVFNLDTAQVRLCSLLFFAS